MSTTTFLNASVTAAIRDHMATLGWSSADLATRLDLSVDEVDARLDGRVEWNIYTLFCTARVMGLRLVDFDPTGATPRRERPDRDAESLREQLVDHAWEGWIRARRSAPGPVLAALRDAIWKLEDALDAEQVDVGDEVCAVSRAVVSVQPWVSDEVAESATATRLSNATADEVRQFLDDVS